MTVSEHCHDFQLPSGGVQEFDPDQAARLEDFEIPHGGRAVIDGYCFGCETMRVRAVDEHGHPIGGLRGTVYIADIR